MTRLGVTFLLFDITSRFRADLCQFFGGFSAGRNWILGEFCLEAYAHGAFLPTISLIHGMGGNESGCRPVAR